MNKRNNALLWMLVATAVLVAALGCYLKYAVLNPLGLYQQENPVAVPFLLMADEEVKYKLQNLQQVEIPAVTENQEETAPAESEAATEAAATEAPEETEAPTEPPVVETEPEVVPIEIDESWFDDALFVGDSRTVGLSTYGRLGDAHYFAEVGMTVYNARSVKKSSTNYSKTNLAGLLSKYEYGKIYIHLGLNEIMTDWDQLFTRYQELIDLIREKQPDAVIILQGIMTVTEKKANSASYFSLESIHAFNERVKSMAVGDQMRYLDVNEWIADENGYLSSEISKDGCHLYGTGYQSWSQWYLDTAATLGIE